MRFSTNYHIVSTYSTAMEYQGVGVPPSQPRHSKFVPRSGRVGKGKVRGAAAAVDAKITPSAILNEELLRSYEVDMTPNARWAN